MAGVKSHEVIDMGPILKGTSPLVNSSNSVGSYKNADELPGGVEPTFVPSRNILFLTVASNRAACLGITDMTTGVCQEDFGGYYDCRRVFIDHMEKSLSEGIYGNPDTFKIHTPLMFLTKKESVELAQSLDGCMEALQYSHTCYNGQFPPCGTCHACILRARGFEQAGIEDPIKKRK
jgi:7-cyano-7-deazaguanine synthase